MEKAVIAWGGGLGTGGLLGDMGADVTAGELKGRQQAKVNASMVQESYAGEELAGQHIEGKSPAAQYNRIPPVQCLHTEHPFSASASSQGENGSRAVWPGVRAGGGRCAARRQGLWAVRMGGSAPNDATVRRGGGSQLPSGITSSIRAFLQVPILTKMANIGPNNSIGAPLSKLVYHLGLFNPNQYLPQH